MNDARGNEIRRRIGLDFDGVICRYSRGWQGEIPVQDPVPGALETIKEFMSRGFEVVIISTRAETTIGHAGILMWLNMYGFPPLKVTSQKIGCVLYVDDRGYRFDGDHARLREFARGDLSTWERPGRSGAPADLCTAQLDGEKIAPENP